MQFEADCPDDIADIARRLEAKLELDHEAVQQLAVGLKLFAEIVLRNRGKEPFSHIRPHLSEFNRTLKSMTVGELE